MRDWLIDTNVLSELRRARPSERVWAFVAGQPGDVLFTREVTFAEVRFAGRVLPVTEDAPLRWRPMLEAGPATGHTFSEPDLLIAALASLAEHIVVGRDTSEFAAAGVPVFDPWDLTLHARTRVLKIADADGPDALARASAQISI